MGRDSQAGLPQQPEQLLRMLGDNLPNGVIYQYLRSPDGNSHFTYISASIERMTGVSADEVLRNRASLYDCIAEEDRERFRLAEDHSFTTLETFDVQVRQRTSSGELMWVHVRAAPRRLGNGDVVWDGIALDITEAKHTESALRESEERFRLLAETIQDVFWIASASGDRVYYISPAYETVWGRSREELYANPLACNEMIHPQDRQHIADTMARYGGQKLEWEYRLTQPDGSQHWIRTRSYPVLDAAGKPTLVVGVSTDVTDLKRTEIALRASQQHYRSLVEDQTEVVSRVLPDGTFTYVNDVFCRFFGRSRSELLIVPWQRNAYNPDVQHVENQLKDLTPKNPVIRIENRVLDASGHLRWMEFVNRGFFGPDGTLLEIQSVGRDITDRKWAELTLEAENRIGAAVGAAESVDEACGLVLPILGQSLDMQAAEFWLFDEDARTLRRRHSWAIPDSSAVGFLASSEGMTFDLGVGLPGQTFAREQAVWMAELGTNRTFVRSAEAATAGLSCGIGLPIPAQPPFNGVITLFGPRMLAQSGRYVQEFTNTLSRHITRILVQKQAEEEIRLNEERYRFLTDSIPPIIYVYDPEGRPIYLNQRWYTYTGQTPEQVMNGRWYEAVLREDRAEAVLQWEESFRTGKNYHAEFRLRRAVDGQYRWHLSQARPMRDNQGRIERWFGSATDIHDMRTAQEDLRRTLHQREVLLKEVHHRVKNNLQVISSLLRLQSRLIGDGAAREALRESQNRVRTMALVHENLYQSGDLAHVNLIDYVRTLTTSIARSYESEGRRITIQLDVEPLALELDQTVPCGLIVNELVSNCFKHAFHDRSQGTVRVRFQTASNEQAVLEVADDGVGLTGPLRSIGASSLGMQLVRELTEQLGGTVTMITSPGTCVVVRFPLR